MADDNRTPRVLGENEAARVVRHSYLSNYERSEVIEHKSIVDYRGALLVDLVRCWGMVAAVRGDDTFSGHTCLEPMEPAAVVARAETMVDLIYERARERGWIVDVDRSMAGDDN